MRRHTALPLRLLLVVPLLALVLAIPRQIMAHSLGQAATIEAIA